MWWGGNILCFLICCRIFFVGVTFPNFSHLTWLNHDVAVWIWWRKTQEAEILRRIIQTTDGDFSPRWIDQRQFRLGGTKTRNKFFQRVANRWDYFNCLFFFPFFFFPSWKVESHCQEKTLYLEINTFDSSPCAVLLLDNVSVAGDDITRLNITKDKMSFFLNWSSQE